MIKLKNLSIAIITGGWSAEREENLTGAQAVRKTLTENGILPLYIEVKRDENFIPQLLKQKIDFAILCITEEVPIQGVLDIMNIPYNGSGPLATSLCLDKTKTKELMNIYKILTPNYVAIKIHKQEEEIKKALKLKFPLIVKPNSLGSSVGLSLVKKSKDLSNAVMNAFKYSDLVLVEEYIKGTEITIPVLGETIFPVVEIISSSGIYDEFAKKNFRASYKPMKNTNPQVNSKIKKTVTTLKTIFNLENIWRVDGILSNNDLYILEINTLPYLGSPYGVMATSFGAINLSHYDFLEKIIFEKLKKPHVNK